MSAVGFVIIIIIILLEAEKPARVIKSVPFLLQGVSLLNLVLGTPNYAPIHATRASWLGKPNLLVILLMSPSGKMHPPPQNRNRTGSPCHFFLPTT
jgi:hypothetical protein